MTARIFAEITKNADASSVPSAGSPSVKPSSSGEETSTAKPKQAYNAAHYSTGAAASSFTSTSLTPVVRNERALVDEDEFMYKDITKKGYAQIVTNLGKLNVELHCDRTPRTCHNFILLAKSG